MARSPNFPNLTLDKALEYARTLYRKIQKTEVDRAVGLKALGYEKEHGQSRAVMAALKAFGLTEASPGKMQLSEDALGIILDKREPSPDRDALVRKLALVPKFHRAAWDHWKGDVPADEDAEFWLTHTQNFTDKGASDFLKEFKATIAFAGLEKPDKIAVTNHGREFTGATPEKTKKDPPEKSTGTDRHLRTEKSGDLMELSTYTMAGGLELTLSAPLPLPSFRRLAEIERLLLESLSGEGIGRPDDHEEGHDNLDVHPEPPARSIQTGDLVQWTSSGVDQFTEPKCVERREGGFVFVEGTKSGIPETEVALWAGL